MTRTRVKQGVCTSVLNQILLLRGDSNEDMMNLLRSLQAKAKILLETGGQEKGIIICNNTKPKLDGLDVPLFAEEG